VGVRVEGFVCIKSLALHACLDHTDGVCVCVCVSVCVCVCVCVCAQAGKPDAAKRAYFRAISSCAWSKSLWLYVLRVAAIRAMMSPQEMTDVVQMMNSKESSSTQTLNPKT
jgi:hypothetical protein